MKTRPTPARNRKQLTGSEKKSTRDKQTGSLLGGGRGLGRRDDGGQEVERVRARGRRRRRARAALPARRVPLQAPRVDDVAAGQRVEQLQRSEDAPPAPRAGLRYLPRGLVSHRLGRHFIRRRVGIRGADVDEG